MQNKPSIIKYALITLLLFATVNSQAADTTTVKAQLSLHHNLLFYPNAVESFYKQATYRAVWIAPDTASRHAWDAMLLLDCVVQYGLNHADYHPKQLVYDKLHQLMAQPGKANSAQISLYDIMLTDAILTFINNLHYGRLNPQWPPHKIDNLGKHNFRAEVVLTNALSQADFKSAILIAQPTTTAYKALQYNMHVITGLYTGDCYLTPQSRIKLMAINLERLRWEKGSKPYIAINIPSKTLSYYTADTIYSFKITGTLPVAAQFTLRQFTYNNKAVTLYLSSTLLAPGKHSKANLVVIPGAGRLVTLLLHKKPVPKINRFALPKPVLINETYYTCEMVDGYLAVYKDILGLDGVLEDGIYLGGD